MTSSRIGVSMLLFACSAAGVGRASCFVQLSEQPAPRIELAKLTTADKKRVSLSVCEGSIVDVAKATRAVDLPLNYEESDGEVVEYLEHPGRPVTFDLKQVPYWDAIGRIAQELNLSWSSDHDSVPELTPFRSAPEFWATSGPVMLTFHLNSPREFHAKNRNGIRLEEKDNVFLVIMQHMAGEADISEVILHDVKLRSNKNALHPISLETSSLQGVWQGEELPLPITEVSGIEGGIIASVADHIIRLRVRPGKQTHTDGATGLTIDVGEIEKRKLVEFDGVRIEPGEGFEDLYYLKIVIRWGNELSEQDLRAFDVRMVEGLRGEWDLDEMRRFQTLLKDRVRYSFEELRNHTPTKEAQMKYQNQGEGFARFAATPNFVCTESQGKLTLHLTDHEWTNIETCHEILLARDSLLIGDFQTTGKGASNQDRSP